MNPEDVLRQFGEELENEAAAANLEAEGIIHKVGDRWELGNTPAVLADDAAREVWHWLRKQLIEHANLLEELEADGLIECIGIEPGYLPDGRPNKSYKLTTKGEHASHAMPEKEAGHDIR
jgi:hypothetical protein